MRHAERVRRFVPTFAPRIGLMNTGPRGGDHSGGLGRHQAHARLSSAANFSNKVACWLHARGTCFGGPINRRAPRFGASEMGGRGSRGHTRRPCTRSPDGGRRGPTAAGQLGLDCGCKLLRSGPRAQCRLSLPQCLTCACLGGTLSCVTGRNVRPKSASSDARREREGARFAHLSPLERIAKALELGRRGRQICAMAKRPEPPHEPQ